MVIEEEAIKLLVFVTPRKFGDRGYSHHPASQIVELAMRQLGHTNVQELILGKFYEIELADGDDPEAARQRLLKDAERAGIYSKSIEDCRIEIEK